MGPQAGVDLASKIIANTIATRDQDHIPLFVYGDPSIPDRTQFLFGSTSENPAIHMEEGVKKLYSLGARIVGVACNTAHSPAIFDVFKERLRASCPDLQLLHLIEQTVLGIQTDFPDVQKVGVLGTEGTLRFQLYDQMLIAAGLTPIQPTTQNALTHAIFHPSSGIKACSSPVSEEAKGQVTRAIEVVISKGAQAVILGCTELPIAIPQPSYQGVKLIDPAVYLARALIRAAAPDRLLP